MMGLVERLLKTFGGTPQGPMIDLHAGLHQYLLEQIEKIEQDQCCNFPQTPQQWDEDVNKSNQAVLYYRMLDLLEGRDPFAPYPSRSMDEAPEKKETHINEFLLHSGFKGAMMNTELDNPTNQGSDDDVQQATPSETNDARTSRQGPDTTPKSRLSGWFSPKNMMRAGVVTVLAGISIFGDLYIYRHLSEPTQAPTPIERTMPDVERYAMYQPPIAQDRAPQANPTPKMMQITPLVETYEVPSWADERGCLWNTYKKALEKHRSELGVEQVSDAMIVRAIDRHAGPAYDLRTPSNPDGTRDPDIIREGSKLPIIIDELVLIARGEQVQVSDLTSSSAYANYDPQAFASIRQSPAHEPAPSRTGLKSAVQRAPKGSYTETTIDESYAGENVCDEGPFKQHMTEPIESIDQLLENVPGLEKPATRPLIYQEPQTRQEPALRYETAEPSSSSMRYDAHQAPDTMKQELASLYKDSEMTLKDIAVYLSAKHGMPISASSVSKYGRAAAGLKAGEKRQARDSNISHQRLAILCEEQPSILGAYARTA